MTLKQLEYFLEIARMGSVSKAAEALNISQPPLSLQLKSLEEELNTTLFIRSKQGLKITPEGLLLQSRAEAILELIDEAKSDIQEKTGNAETVIRIGTISSVNNQFLPDRIAGFKESYPKVRFQVFESGTDSVLADLAAGKIDLGFVRRPFNIAKFASRPVHSAVLKEGEVDFFCAIGLPEFFDTKTKPKEIGTAKVSVLQGKPLVIQRRFGKLLTGICQKSGFHPNIICENNEITSALAWASAGIGLAVAPYTSVALNRDDRLMTVRIEDIPMNPELCVVWDPERQMPTEARAFIKSI